MFDGHSIAMAACAHDLRCAGWVGVHLRHSGQAQSRKLRYWVKVGCRNARLEWATHVV